MTPEVLTRVDGVTDGVNGGAWWSRYHRALQASGLTETALQVVELDAQFILEKGIFGSGKPGEPGSAWPESRVRRGLVVGSVQSGKTASMLGVAAMGLDEYVDIVVLLTGTRVALWRQTVDRTLDQLDGWSTEVDSARRLERILLPPPKLIAGRRGAPELADLYFEQPGRVHRNLQKRRPLIAIVMKQADHLIRFGGYLRDALEGPLRRLQRPLHLLVIDDEADDGSILDAVVESNLGPDSEGLKQIPRHIARLWAGRGQHQATLHEQLYATYVAYTATPQANILQSDHNPLSPSDFVVALRTPFDVGSVGPPRSTTFEETKGLRRYYSGGEIFYRRLARDPGALCVPSVFPDLSDFDSEGEFTDAVDQQRLELVGDSLRAFFVAAAMRLLDSGKSLSVAKTMPPATWDEVLQKSPEPGTMLVHPSMAIGEQIHTAQLIAAWSGDPNLATVEPIEFPTDAAGKATLDPDGLCRRLASQPEHWKFWFDSYEETREKLASLFTGHGYHRMGPERWDEICDVLTNQVFPHTQLRVINSDPAADDRPLFKPVAVEDGLFGPAPDLLSIFVSGNVMARGITLEGLTTSLFLRSSASPSADTQIQMQRWFGYRGSYLYWCRVFLYNDQLALFRAYHENDEALRNEVIAEMDKPEPPSPSPLVLQGLRFRATGKIANLRALPLCPGPQPFVRIIDTGAMQDNNANVLADLLDKPVWEELKVGNTVRGLIWNQQLSMLEVAEVLESFRYEGHAPDPSAPNHDRWRALEGELQLEPALTPLFRPPQRPPCHIDGIAPHSCPYTIAAYLRLWSAALSRPARGLFPTDDHTTPWSMINLSSYAVSAPSFYVGVRFGLAGPARNPRLREHDILRMDRAHEDGVLIATWGSRNPGEGQDTYFGDHLFDYHQNGFTPAAQIAGQPPWRPRGHPGLLLFHTIRVGEAEAVAPAITLPIGGPDHFAALPPPTLAQAV